MLDGSLLYSAKFVVLALYYSSDLTIQRGTISQWSHATFTSTKNSPLPLSSNVNHGEIIVLTIVGLCEYRRQKLTMLLLMYYKLSNQILQT